MEKFHFKKIFGQNFLKGSSYTQKIVDPLGLVESDTVVEIGPGRGAVTSLIYGKVKKLILVEIDSELIEYLTKTFPDAEIVNEDIIKFDPSTHGLEDLKYKLVGSLPYNISKQIISKFLTEKARPSIMSVLIQKEVADDYVSKIPRAAFLANFAQAYSSVSSAGNVPKEEFHPTPKVDGGILKFELSGKIQESQALLVKFIKAGYSSPRKKLISNLANSYRIDKPVIENLFKELKISENARPAELTFEQWSKLYQSLKKQKLGSLK